MRHRPTLLLFSLCIVAAVRSFHLIAPRRRRPASVVGVVVKQPTTTTTSAEAATTCSRHCHCRRAAAIITSTSSFLLSARSDGDGAVNDGEKGKINESAYDITQRLFPEDRRIKKESSFADGERSEMNDRPPPPPASVRDIGVSFPAFH